jgi:predicted dehydrogenase
MDTSEPVSVLLVGCGAIAELLHAPTLAALEQAGAVRVAGLVDPAPARRAVLGKFFPHAPGVDQVAALPATAGATLGLVASPARFHAEHTLALFARGAHVLCEKPLAATLAEADAMNNAAARAGCLLAAGHIRRFYPSVRGIRSILQSGRLGHVRDVDYVEGHRFGWPAATPSFFRRDQGGGGVLLDVGIHVLDTLRYWLGEPAEALSADDALGGVETNATVHWRWADGLDARVRLSWDTLLENGCHIRCEAGEIYWRGNPEGFELQVGQTGDWLAGQVHTVLPGDLHRLQAGDDYGQAFLTQLRNVLGAMAGREPLVCPGADAARNLAWLERARAQRTPLAQPWLSPAEQAGAARLAALT